MQPSAVLFPNAAITVTPAIVDFIYFEPVTPGRTTMHMWYYFVGDAAEAPEHECSRQLVYTDFENANREDEGICARMQEGRTCDAYDGGRLSPYWDLLYGSLPSPVGGRDSRPGGLCGTGVMAPETRKGVCSA